MVCFKQSSTNFTGFIHEYFGPNSLRCTRNLISKKLQSLFHELTSCSLVRSYSWSPSLKYATWFGPSVKVTMIGHRVIIWPDPRGNNLALAIISSTLVLPADWSPITTILIKIWWNLSLNNFHGFNFSRFYRCFSPLLFPIGSSSNKSSPNFASKINEVNQIN